MVESDRHRSKKTVQIDQSPVAISIIKIGALTLFQIENDPESIQQDVLLQTFEKLQGSLGFPAFFVFCSAAGLRRNRLGERGRHTHPLIVIARAISVNRSRPYFPYSVWFEQERTVA